ncbi:MAG: hypothetical protein GX868_13600 [Actinobacteria bacterium]|nr:hypothetical protein [Actinomycetota bacterium]
MLAFGSDNGMGGWRSRRGPIVALSIATLVIVPWVIVDAVTGDDGSSVETTAEDPSTSEADAAATSATTATSAASATSTTTTAPGEADGGTQYAQVSLAASWLPRGTSRYSETDDQTESRIRRQKLGQRASPAPAPDTTVGGPASGGTGGNDGAVTVPTKKPTDAGSTTTTPQKQTTAPPQTQPPATQPPVTQPPPTQPPEPAPPAPPAPTPDPPVAAAPAAGEVHA